MLCADSKNPNAGNGGALYSSISGNDVTAHTALIVTCCDMQNNRASGAGNCCACEVIVTVVLFRELCNTELYGIIKAHTVTYVNN